MTRPHRPKKRPGASPESRKPLYIYGRHPVMAALANPRRHKLGLHASEKGLASLDQATLPTGLAIERREVRELDHLVGAVPHQGLVLAVEPLAPQGLAAMLPAPETPSLIVLLDQVEDPHNVGAILRSAAIFGADALITQDRHSPPESGALAKAASGALDIIPWIRVTNISATLETLASEGYWSVGLDGSGDNRIDRLDPGSRLVLALGAEGHGLRPLVARHCDILARIEQHSKSPLLDSLNVSNAAAIALHCLSGGR